MRACLPASLFAPRFVRAHTYCLGRFTGACGVSSTSIGAALAASCGGAAAASPGPLHCLLLTARDVARGMAHLHRHAVIHGDLKPSNVLLKSDPNDPRGFVALVRQVRGTTGYGR